MNSRKSTIRLWLHQATAQLSKGKCQLDATTAVCQAQLDRQVVQAKMEDQAVQDNRDPLASLVNHRKRSASCQRLHHANHVHQESLENLDLKDPLVTPVLLAHLAMLAKMVNQEDLVHKAPLARLETPAPMDLVVNPVHPPSALQQLPETQDPLVPMVHQAQLVNQELVVTMVLQALLARKARLVPLVPLARTAVPAKKDHQVPMVQGENPEFARNIAPWTAVFSSKMEQDAKQQFSRPHLFHLLFASVLQSRGNGHGESSLLLAVHLCFLLPLFLRNLKFRTLF